MPAIFSTLGGTTLTLTVVGMQVLSLIVMAAISLEYLHIHHKRMSLLKGLHCEEGKADLSHGKTVMVIYIILTVLIAIASIVLFVFRPDFL